MKDLANVLLAREGMPTDIVFTWSQNPAKCPLGITFRRHMVSPKWLRMCRPNPTQSDPTEQRSK